ncbi:hypothetical protein BSLG_000277 [Batrachochytrium salamandrivorans]|nr:hypothetical protein BSLG_000277 [Batrachochytrium salamandrivorans]
MSLPLKVQLWVQQNLAGRSRLLRTVTILIVSMAVVIWALSAILGGMMKQQQPSSHSLPLDSPHQQDLSWQHQERVQPQSPPVTEHKQPPSSIKPLYPSPVQPSIDKDFVVVAGDRFYTPKAMPVLKTALDGRIFNASGFTFCDILNGARFDATVHIDVLGGSVAQVNPDRYTFVDAVDAKAHDIFQSVLYQSEFGDRKVKPNREELRRLSCYFSAEGNSAYANFTQTRLLVEVEPLNYFRDRLKAIVPHPSLIPGPRRKYLIAYLLMVHEENGFPHLRKLLETLDDGDAIILIHVDNRPKSNNLKVKIEDFIGQRERLLGSPTNVFLSKYRFSNIWGHSSLVFTQLSGFWELLDMADWDYVINLSNYDFPLRRNVDIHRILNKPNNRGKNFIEYWPDTEDLAERFYRAHIGDADFSSLFHPNGLGVTSWPFPRWRAYKHHQWMIVSPDFIRFLRSDSDALNFLAFSEHIYIPDESYFATVLVNSPQFSDTVVNDNKRYLRFAGGGAAHPSWLGYKDRFLFPAGEPEPSFFFIRKMNVFGTSFEEGRLLEWIDTHHMHSSFSIDGNEAQDNQPCKIEDASVRIACLKEFGDKFSVNNELVIVAVNRAFLVHAANLRCSLVHSGINNLVYWSLDIEVHESLISKGRLSIFLAGFPSTSERQDPSKPYFVKMMRYKPKVLAMFLEAGFNVWYMDADSVSLQDFRPEIVADESVHVHVALGNEKRIDINLAGEDADVPLASAGIMYLRNHPSSKLFIQHVLDMQTQSMLLSDQDAMRKVIANRDLVVTSFTTSQTAIKRRGLVRRSDYDVHKRSDDVYNPSNVDRTSLHIAEKTNGKFPRGMDSHPAKIHIRYFDQFQFINGIILFDHTTEIPMNFDQFKVVHSRPLENPAATLSKWGLWFLDSKGTCANKDSSLLDARMKLLEQASVQGNWVR